MHGYSLGYAGLGHCSRFDWYYSAALPDSSNQGSEVRRDGNDEIYCPITTAVAILAEVAIALWHFMHKQKKYIEEEFKMAKSKFVKANEKIAEGVVSGYKKIEDGVVDGYKKIEDGVVGGFTKMTDKFVDHFLTKEDESVEDAKKRLAQEQAVREAEVTARQETAQSVTEEHIPSFAPEIGRACGSQP